MDNKHLDKALFEFVQVDAVIYDSKLETKPVGFFKDCWNRFRKNKASVAASVIILLLFIFAIFAPLATDYGVHPVSDEGYYKMLLPRTKNLKWLGWDGVKKQTLSAGAYDWIDALGVENDGKRAAIVEIKKEYVADGKTYYEAKVDSYLKVGYVYFDVSIDDYNNLQEYQNETGIQVMYPIPATYKNDFKALSNANLWYKLADDTSATTGLAARDENGNYVANYLTAKTVKDKYNSTRIEGDEPIFNEANERVYYQYGVKNQTGYKIRVCYYDYYVYKYGTEPCFWFGTDQFCNDIFTCLGLGARLSFILALSVSLINLIIGFVYGAIEGYYGGIPDLFMERLSDILAAVPFIVVATLFQLHMAEKVGAFPSLLFAFVTTGWIGIASGVRTQFYRYKNQEYVLAARTLGASDARLIWRHIFPNAMGTIITSCVLIIPGVIFSESILSYLGIVSFKTSGTFTSIGTMLSNGESYLATSPHIIAFPAAFISMLEISFNLFGNGLRDAFNPSLRGSDE